MLVYHQPTPETLERHLEYLSCRYQFVSLTAVVEAMHSRRGDSLPPNALVLTFDDGYRENVDLAGLFERYGVVPTIYLCSQLVDTDRRFWFTIVPDPEPLKHLPNAERLAVLAQSTGFSPTLEYTGSQRQALSRDEIDTLGATSEFGSHTRFHPILPSCSDQDAETEIRASRLELEAMVGRGCQHFSYPNGDYTQRDVELVKAAGYRSGRTVEVGWNDANSDPFRLKVLGVPDDASINRLAADLSGVTSNIGRFRRAIERQVSSRRGRRPHAKEDETLASDGSADPRKLDLPDEPHEGASARPPSGTDERDVRLRTSGIEETANRGPRGRHRCEHPGEASRDLTVAWSLAGDRRT